MYIIIGNNYKAEMENKMGKTTLDEVASQGLSKWYLGWLWGWKSQAQNYWKGASCSEVEKTCVLRNHNGHLMKSDRQAEDEEFKILL